MIYIYFPSKILLSSAVLWFFAFVATKSEAVLSDCDIERLLKPLLTSPNDHTIQAQALRQRLANLMRQGINEQADNGVEEKRSISSLARWNDLPNTKRNVQALARAGYLNNLRYDIDANDNDSNFKRDTLYTNDNNDKEQLDEMLKEETKRGIQSLARNGELPHTRQQIEELIDELYEKRNIGSLARDYNFPNYGKRFLGSLARNGDLRYNSNKRNIASIIRNGKPNTKNSLLYGYDEYKRNIGSLARNGEKPGKRNVAALLRQDNYLNRKHEQESNEDTEQDIEQETERPSERNDEDNDTGFKRNIGSIKSSYKPKYKRSASIDSNNYRGKRQADYYDDLNEEYLQPVYQNQNGYYDDLINELGESYPTADKRFLGRLPQMGKTRKTPTPKLRRRIKESI